MLLFFCCSIEFYIGISIPTFVFSINTSAGSFRVSHGTLFPAVRDVSACSAGTHNNPRFCNHVSQVNAQCPCWDILTREIRKTVFIRECLQGRQNALGLPETLSKFSETLHIEGFQSDPFNMLRRTVVSHRFTTAFLNVLRLEVL